MKKTFSDFFKGNLLLKGSFLLLIGNSLANFGAYLFHLIMGRALGPADYGILESLISLTYFLNIPITVIGLIVVKFISEHYQDKKIVASFIKNFSLKAARIGLLVVFLFFLFFPLIKNLLKVESFILFFGVGTTAYLSIFMMIAASSFQGMMDFLTLSLYNPASTFLKLVLAAVLVSWGLGVGGAIWAIAITVFLTVTAGYWLLNQRLNIFKNKDYSFSFPQIGSYSLALFVANLSLTSFFTTDILLARYFLPPVSAGEYAALSVLGKIIFFASSSVASVMFPVVSQEQAQGKDYRQVFIFSFLLVFGISLMITLAYFFLPKLMVNLLFGKGYLGIVQYLGLFGIFLSLYSLCSLLINFFLSLSNNKTSFSLPIFAVLQVVLISFYHQTISVIVEANIVTMALLLLSLLVYYVKVIHFSRLAHKTL